MTETFRNADVLMKQTISGHAIVLSRTNAPVLGEIE